MPSSTTIIMLHTNAMPISQPILCSSPSSCAMPGQFSTTSNFIYMPLSSPFRLPNLFLLNIFLFNPIPIPSLWYPHTKLPPHAQVPNSIPMSIPSSSHIIMYITSPCPSQASVTCQPYPHTQFHMLLTITMTIPNRKSSQLHAHV